MKTVNIVLLVLILLIAIGIGGYFALERAAHERDLRNYPTAYTELVRSYAEEFSLDPYLVTAIMRCESSNDPNAVSKKGAIGLMQIMPDTGAWIAHKLKLDESYTETQLYDPETNIRFACWYLAFLERRLNNNETCVIAAYNAGHGSVEKWLSDTAFAENGELLTIPFPETARYLEKVRTAYDKYRELYPDLYNDAVAGEAE